MSELQVRHASDEVSLEMLGPLRLRRGGEELAVGPPQRRAVLALLALAGGQPIGRDELCAALWPVRPPTAAANVLQTHVKNLRRVLEPWRPRRAGSVLLPSVGPGYALRVPRAAVDALRFRALVAAARAARVAGDRERLRREAGAALRLWRRPLPDVPALAGHGRVAALVTEWRQVLGWYADEAIRADRGDEVLTTVEQDAGRHPLDERAQARLLRLYCAVGRRADAVASYHLARRRLRDELGIDPGPELAGAYRELLRCRGPVRAAPGGAPAPGVPPAQLPPRPAEFVGRAAELRRLDLATAAPVAAAEPVLLVVEGPAGVGKSALALQWAHRGLGRFPDGQLYANLGSTAAGPAEVLRNFLRALGLPEVAERTSCLDGLASAYRSAVAGRRLLVVLDDVRDPAQVPPLLPGRGPSVVALTTREPIGGPLVVHRGERVPLGPLSPEEAVALVRRLDARQRRPAPGEPAVPVAGDRPVVGEPTPGGAAAVAYAWSMRSLLSRHPEPASALVTVAVAGGLPPDRAAGWIGWVTAGRGVVPPPDGPAAPPAVAEDRAVGGTG
ncbi:winged helix-turn-helix domain-containing protein [Micromonospora sp. PLK6-60]|uniref:AfsR/SARP family transcriptional regulator n=1 Tax=Micromonospora sp. PLK6-60 TaxID=2873383 RepID=UPI001CA783D1|nr:BTAD domain-containing putative transcriptional regulator [Micromonospora sp. PLK6-60]MBY8872671.1 winged helix-turn-helix domain-containing protein [Micromonospora sp. PLK6-60]